MKRGHHTEGTYCRHPRDQDTIHKKIEPSPGDLGLKTAQWVGEPDLPIWAGLAISSAGRRRRGCRAGG